MHSIFYFQISGCEAKAREFQFPNLAPLARGFTNFMLNLTEVVHASFSTCVVFLTFSTSTARQNIIKLSQIGLCRLLIFLVYKHQNNIEKSQKIKFTLLGFSIFDTTICKIFNNSKSNFSYGVNCTVIQKCLLPTNPKSKCIFLMGRPEDCEI